MLDYIQYSVKKKKTWDKSYGLFFFFVNNEKEEKYKWALSLHIDWYPLLKNNQLYNNLP